MLPGFSMLCELTSLFEWKHTDGALVGSVASVCSEVIFKVAYFGCLCLTNRADVNRIVPIGGFVNFVLSHKLPFIALFELL